MKRIINIFKSKDELARFFALKLSDGIRDIPEGHYFTIALSGGSTPGMVFAWLASNFREQIDWQKVKVFWGDERCVPPESDDSNFRMASESLLVHVPIPESNIYRIKGENNPESEAIRYEEVVHRNIRSQNDIPRFDLIMLGLGEDGHTASIFPGNTQLFSSEKTFEMAENPYSGQKRITATGRIINNAKTVVFVVTGESKAEMVSRVIENKEGREKLPAAMVQPVKGEIIWLLDEKAAALLGSEFKIKRDSL
jgi:6-phosphogluconolactonase